MKVKVVSIFLMFILFSIAYLPISFAQDSPQWHLPEGAKSRLGKGTINEIAYSPDGALLAVAGRGGIWLYNTETSKRLRCSPAYKRC